MTREQKILSLLTQFKELGIDQQIDYNKFYLYSIITHSTAIEGSTVTEIENQLLFDEGISAKGRSMTEQLMNLDLKAAYERSIVFAKSHSDISVDMLKKLSSIILKNTGTIYQFQGAAFVGRTPHRGDRHSLFLVDCKQCGLPARKTTLGDRVSGHPVGTDL